MSGMEGSNIKVVWLCHFSNEFVHSKLNLQLDVINKIASRLKHKPVNTQVADFAVWITNGIQEMVMYEEVELHVVSPYPYLSSNIQEFEDGGIHYHFFKNELDCGIKKIICKVFRIVNNKYVNNRRLISGIIKSIKPDIVHLIGAENPHYSLAILDVPKEIITIAQLQTLMNDPDFINSYPITKRAYKYRSGIEKRIIQNVDYIGTKEQKYRNIVKEQINPNAHFVSTILAIAEPVVSVSTNKIFDFVYYASNINKAADLAIEAFGIAYQDMPNITLDIIGAYDDGYKQQLDIIIQKYGMVNAVTFEGKLLTHDDVLNQIRKSRFALLPLRIDLVSGTIREAMSNGLPVLTTDTGELGTRCLNKDRQSVLISPIGSHKALAMNMVRLLNDDKLANTLRQNAYQTRNEAESNKMIIKKYVDVYSVCLAHHRSGIPLPIEITDL